MASGWPKQKSIMEAIGGKRDTLLHIAVRDNNIDVVKKTIKCGTNIDSRNIAGRTPILTAAIHGNIEIVELLAKKGANLNTSEYTNCRLGEIRNEMINITPVMIASDRNHIKVVRTLVEYGAYFSIDDISLEKRNIVIAELQSWVEEKIIKYNTFFSIYNRSILGGGGTLVPLRKLIAEFAGIKKEIERVYDVGLKIETENWRMPDINYDDFFYNIIFI